MQGVSKPKVWIGVENRRHTTLRRLFAPCKVNARNGDVSPTTMIEVFPTYCEFLGSVPMDRVSTLISMM